MNESAKDYDLDDTTERTLTFIEKCKRIWDAYVWLRRVVMACKILFWGTTATVIVGQAVNENYVQEAAFEMGLIDRAALNLDTRSAAWNIELSADILALQKQLTEHRSHNHDYPDPVIPAPVVVDHPHPYAEKHGHPYAAEDHTHPVAKLPAHNHPTAPMVMTPGLEDAVEALIEKQNPPRHLKLHGGG
jgi:hypothetical protein